MSIAPALNFPYPQAPETGSLTEIAPGILWLRLSLPFALDHVNVYLFEDGDGWTTLDAGLGDETTRVLWERVFNGRLRGKRLRRIIGTHYHPDHVGQVGWLADRFGAELHMSRTEYLISMLLTSKRDAIHSPKHGDFYERNGLGREATEIVMDRGHRYLEMTTGLPKSFERLVAGHSIDIGGREFEISTGGGHAPEQVMLLCRADKLFFPADQVLARISPNVSVWPWEPEDNPLDEYLISLKALREQIPGDVSVFPAHNLPFYGLHARLDDLLAHHRERCDRITAACAETPRSASEIVPVLFRRPLNPHETGFAFGEVMAHLNYMKTRGELTLAPPQDGIRRFHPE